MNSDAESAAALPDFAAVRAAQARIASHAHLTPVLRSRALDAMVGAELWFKCENLQRSGAFKFRGACNAVWSVDDACAKRGFVTHSSGNHGAALALAARTRGVSAHVIVPENAVRTKLAAIQGYGAELHYCAPTMAAREAMAEQVRAETGAEMVHPFTDPRVICGQGTAALELLEHAGALDALITPVGGGGLSAGTALAGHGLDPRLALYAAEPSGADDASRSLATGRRVTEQVPDTICDGLRGIIGPLNFTLLQQHQVQVLTVPDAETLAAMRLIFERMKLVVEPSSAIVLAALLRQRELFRGRRVGVILSGGNVELDALHFA